MEKVIIKQNVQGLNKLNEEINQATELIQKIIDTYSKLNITPLQSINEFEVLTLNTEDFVRSGIVAMMENRTIGGISLSVSKLKEMIELPSAYVELLQIIEHYKLIKNKKVFNCNLDWFEIENGVLIENTINIESYKSSFVSYATTPEHFTRLEAFNKLRDAIYEAKEVFGNDLIEGFRNSKIISVSPDLTEITPKVNAILY